MATAAIHLLSLPDSWSPGNRVFAAVVRQVTQGVECCRAAAQAPDAPERVHPAKGWHIDPAHHCAIYAAR